VLTHLHRLVFNDSRQTSWPTTEREADVSSLEPSTTTNASSLVPSVQVTSDAMQPAAPHTSQEKKRVELRWNPLFPRRLIVTQSASLVTAGLYGKKSSMLAWAKSAPDDCWVRSAAEPGEKASLWIGSTAFDMSAADAKTIADEFGFRVDQT